MKRVRALVFGLIVGLAVGLWLGYNHGRGAPLLTNPFAEHTIIDEAKQRAEEAYEEGSEAAQDKLEEMR